jgi:hypothetical protein
VHAAGEGEMDHGFQDVYPLLVIADQPLPSGHSAEGAFDQAAPWQHREIGFLVGPSDDLEDEISTGCGIHGAGAVIGAVGEQMPEPGLAPADRRYDRLRTGAVEEVRGGEIDRQQPAFGDEGDVALASRTFLSASNPRFLRLAP